MGRCCRGARGEGPSFPVPHYLPALHSIVVAAIPRHWSGSRAGRSVLSRCISGGSVSPRPSLPSDCLVVLAGRPHVARLMVEIVSGEDGR